MARGAEEFHLFRVTPACQIEAVPKSGCKALDHLAIVDVYDFDLVEEVPCDKSFDFLKPMLLRLAVGLDLARDPPLERRVDMNDLMPRRWDVPA